MSVTYLTGISLREGTARVKISVLSTLVFGARLRSASPHDRPAQDETGHLARDRRVIGSWLPGREEGLVQHGHAVDQGEGKADRVRRIHRLVSLRLDLEVDLAFQAVKDLPQERGGVNRQFR